MGVGDVCASHQKLSGPNQTLTGKLELVGFEQRHLITLSPRFQDPRSWAFPFRDRGFVAFMNFTYRLQKELYPHKVFETRPRKTLRVARVVQAIPARSAEVAQLSLTSFCTLSFGWGRAINEGLRVRSLVSALGRSKWVTGDVAP